MLRELSVQNLALIEDIHVELEDGYCAWTGETGAGKSLLLTALGLVLGDKASADLIRSGKTEARAAAVFEITEPGLRGEVEEVLGCSLDDEQLVITRRLSSHGRGSAHVNGLPVAITTLQKLARLLVDIHGQLEGRALLDPDRQRELLDAYGGLEGLVRAYRHARLAHEALRRKRQALLDSAATRRRERALLEFERAELAAADPRPGEYDELTRKARRQKMCRANPNRGRLGLLLPLRGGSLGPGTIDEGCTEPRAAHSGRARARGGDTVARTARGRDA